MYRHLNFIGNCIFMDSMDEQHPERDKMKDKYGTTCIVFNSLMVLLMTAVTVVIQILIGVPLLVMIIVSLVLLFLYAWIEEHYISRFVNALVEKVLKEDIH